MEPEPETPPKLSCPECLSTAVTSDSEGACRCENDHRFWDTETWEWRTLRRAQAAERALTTWQELADGCRHTNMGYSDGSSATIADVIERLTRLERFARQDGSVIARLLSDPIIFERGKGLDPL